MLARLCFPNCHEAAALQHYPVRKPVIVVNAYTVRKTDLQKLRDEKHKQLAREMAREDWSVR